jgi:uridine kinase
MVRTLGSLPEAVPVICLGATRALPPDRMTTRIIAVDGLGGAGKTTLARELAGSLGRCPVVQTDDFASWEDPLDWWPRLVDEILRPLREGRAAVYRRYDWGLRQPGQHMRVDPSDYVILEGVSASRRAFRPYLTFTVWVETPRQQRLARGVARDGEDMRGQWERWMDEEDRYVEQENPRSAADVVVLGARPVGPAR